MFNIERTAASGPVTVGSGAMLNILAGATVNITGAKVDAGGNYDVASGVYQMARNNVLKDDSSSNAVAVSNFGQFNVNSGLQTVGAITGSTGVTSINADASDPGTVLNAPQVNQGTISIGAGAELHLTNSGLSALSMTSALNIAGTAGAWTGLLDVDQTGIMVADGNLATIRDEIIEGRHNGTWTGLGISSTAASDNSKLAVGYALVGSEVEIATVIAGDADLNGTVNGADLNTVLSNFNQTGMTWSQGDFDYNGTVNGADLNTVLSNFNQHLSVSGAVPEPSTLLLAAAGLAGLLAYAWRKRK